MAGDMFLQEAEAAVLVFDLRGFTPLCARLGPIELGAALGRFYEHCEAAVDAGGGRVIKLVGDMVVSVWVAGQHGPPHGGHTGSGHDDLHAHPPGAHRTGHRGARSPGCHRRRHRDRRW